ncbi:reverse transcriptase/maturase family protein [Vibrio parahaemolyticus]|uniref:reverse transcriptase/maturase family protein n=1 Tax=Vibrio parahaemolyticus TaxID=670 RepID=UPI00224025D1|nr:reverse transcriptase/maturase family protein [Vibrio parahaemolyticus]MDL2005825.1 reverse transcriptase/maturase family protein [Vibrio parahaemolyticus]
MFEQIIQFENLMAAAHDAQKGKRFKAPVMRYMSNVEENLINTQNHLIWGSYVPSQHRRFCVYEPKMRTISAPPFHDRVVHHAIHRVIEPIIDKRFIFDSYACRVGKGTHSAADRVQRFIRIVKKNNGKVFALKADISKFFNSINHATLKCVIGKHIGCKRTLALLERIVDHSDTDTDGVGIPIGNLTSQLFANLYLNELDQFVKHGLRERFYARYMDDFVVIHHDKSHLQRVRKQIEDWLWVNLQLKTNNKTQVFPVGIVRGRALDFVGYRIYATHKTLRKCTEKRFKHKVKVLRRLYSIGEVGLDEVRPVVCSYIGCASHANAYNLISSVLSVPFVRSYEDARPV